MKEYLGGIGSDGWVVVTSIRVVLVATEVFVGAQNVVRGEIKALRARVGPTRRSRRHIACKVIERLGGLRRLRISKWEGREDY